MGRGNPPFRFAMLIPGRSVSLSSAIAVTAITNTNPCVVTTSGAGSLQTGDKVLVQNSTGMLQISPLLFQITVTGPSTFTLNGLDASSFSAPATGGNVRKLIVPPNWQPLSYMVIGITRAHQAVVTLSIDHNYEVGQVVYLRVNKQFGMQQADGATSTILAVTPNTMTLDLDTSTFNDFAFPASNDGPFDFPNLGNYGTRSSLVLNPYNNTL